MFSNTLTKILAILDVVLLVILVILYIKMTTLKETIKQQKTEISILNQNNLALQDQAKMLSDSLQNFAIYIKNLQELYNKKNNEYNILASKYKIAIDSIKILNKPAETHEDNNIIVVSFKGKEGKISYNGQTTYFKINGESSHSIKISVDTINIVSRIYVNEDKIIRNEVYADGNLITAAQTEIDSSIYTLIYNSTHENESTMSIFDRIRAVLELNQKIIHNGTIYKADEFNIKFGIRYLFNKNFELYGYKNILDKGGDIGVRFTPSIKDLTKLIF